MATTTTAAAAADDINARDDSGRTKIFLAAKDGDVAKVARLLDLKADFELATDIVKYTPLHIACQEGHAPVVRLLLDAGANIEAKNFNNQTPLLLAASKGHLPVVRLLVDAKAKLDVVDEYGYTVVHWAADGDHAKVVHFFAKIGVNIHETNDYWRLPIHIAAQNGRNDALLTLIAWGATGNEQDGVGRTPLHWASGNDNADTCKLLCALDDVDVNAVNDYGKTALDYAIGDVDSVRALLEFNVDTSKARVNADTRVEIVQLLEEHRKRSENERIAIRTRVLEEQRAKIQKYFKFEVFEWREIHEIIVDFTIAIGHMTRSSYELMWIFNFVQLTPRLFIGDVHEDYMKLRVIDKVKSSVAAVHERREAKQQFLKTMKK